MSKPVQQVFAQNAWLGPGQFSKRVLITFDESILEVEMLSQDARPPDDAILVEWLTPGFINAHCHLEYSWLADKMPRGAIPFGDWMRAIMSARPLSEVDDRRRLTAMETAADELIRGGCTMVFDSTTDASSGTVLATRGIKHYLFHEVLGLTRERAEPMLQQALERIESYDRASGIGCGLNPHAPYSVGIWLREQLKAGPASNYAHAWHIAETPDEEELFLSGAGSVAQVLQDFGLPLPYENCPETGTFNFLKEQGQLETCEAAFHGNMLTLAEALHFQGRRILVHCPTTHRWFARPKVDLKGWMAAGVNVCLGTDSRASSDSLSMLELVRMTAEDHPELSADQLLQMVCSNPGTAGFLSEHLSGVLERGAAADLVGLKAAGNMLTWNQILLSDKSSVGQVWVDGECRFRLNKGAI